MTRPLFPIAFVISAALACGGLAAESLPAIPPSTRILTLDLVKNCWINTLQSMPVPSKPTGLHPERQAAWKRRLDERNGLIQAIRNGDRDIDAKLATLRHNATAWHQLGNIAKAEAAETQIREINEHLARMATLELQRKVAKSQIDSAERLKDIAAELASLKACCDQ